MGCERPESQKQPETIQLQPNASTFYKRAFDSMSALLTYAHGMERKVEIYEEFAQKITRWSKDKDAPFVVLQKIIVNLERDLEVEKKV